MKHLSQSSADRENLLFNIYGFCRTQEFIIILYCCGILKRSLALPYHQNVQILPRKACLFLFFNYYLIFGAQIREDLCKIIDQSRSP